MTKYNFGCKKSPLKFSDYLITPLLLGVKDDGQDIDYSNEQSPVKNQMQKGSCVGFSGVAVKEYEEFKETGKFFDLSEQWLYEKARQKGGYTEGATLADAFYIVSHEGVPLEKYWPYTDDITNIGKPEEGADKNAMIYRISDKLYFRLTDAGQIRTTLLKFGSFQLGIKVYKNWYRQKDGHIPTSTICERVQGALGGHAINIVGSFPSKKEYKFKNSWGDWGDKGYGYLTEIEMKQSFMDAFAWVDIANIDTNNILTVAQIPKMARKVLFA